MNKLTSILISLIILSHTPSIAQTLNESVQELDSYFLKVMDDWHIPGMAIGVVKGDQIVFLKGYGYRDVDKKLPVDENTLFPIKGIDNGFTDVAIGVLQDQGKISLDKPLEQFLPGLRMYDSYVTDHVTLYDFMTERTGLARHGFLWFGTDYSRDHVFKILSYLEPVTGFREPYPYSAVTPYVEKYAVDQLSGSPYEVFVSNSLFKPLEMNTTFFGFEFEQKENMALPYTYDPESKKFNLNVRWFKDLMQIYNDGNNPGIFSSAKEMCNWMIMNLNGGKFKGKQIVSADFISQTQSLKVPFGNSDYSSGDIDLGSSFGSFISYFHGHHMVTQYAHKGMFDSRLMLFPADSLGIIVLTGSTYAGRWIISEVLAEKLILDKYRDWNQVGLNKPAWVNEMKEQPKPERPVGLNKENPPSLKLSAYEGKYVNKAYGEIAIKEENDQLKGKRSITNFELDHIEKDRFKMHAGESYFNFKTIEFHVDNDGKVNKLSIDFNRELPPTEFIRVR